MSEGIKGKVVLITGASSGLGEATARLLHQQGAKVVLGARRLPRLVALTKEFGIAEEAAIKVDVTHRADVEHFVQCAIKLHGRVDVFINNAGLMPSSFLENLHVDEWDQMVDVNIKGVLYGIAAVLPHMKRQNSGHIINVSSVAGHKINPGGAVYAATKHAVRALSEGLRQEVQKYNIRTTIISPGAVSSELIETITDPVVAEGMRKGYEAAVPPETFARTVAFAISQPADVDINEILFRPTAQAF